MSRAAAPEVTRDDAAAQQTLARAITVRGTGVHSGQPVNATLRPALADHGIRFRRVDLDNAPEVVARPQALEGGVRATTLAGQTPSGPVYVRTVEHLLAVCHALQVDNLDVELDADELPILDGSAAAWLKAFDEAGIVGQGVACRPFRVQRPTLWTHGETHLIALPHPALRLTVASITEHPIAGNQTIDVEVTPASFRTALASARTFCYLEEVEKLLAAGLARGGSLDNAIVIRPDGFSSPLRMENELAAHKALDLLGDLALLGVRVLGHIVAIRPGHYANQQLVRDLWVNELKSGETTGSAKGPLMPACT